MEKYTHRDDTIISIMAVDIHLEKFVLKFYCSIDRQEYVAGIQTISCDAGVGQPSSVTTGGCVPSSYTDSINTSTDLLNKKNRIQTMEDRNPD